MVRPHTTIPIFAADTRLPFDVNFLRALPYKVDASGSLVDPTASWRALAAKLETALKAAKDQPPTDSPVYQLLDWWKSPDVAHAKDAMLAQAFEHSARGAILAKARLLVAPTQKDRSAHLDEALRAFEGVERDIAATSLTIASHPAGPPSAR